MTSRSRNPIRRIMEYLNSIGIYLIHSKFRNSLELLNTKVPNFVWNDTNIQTPFNTPSEYTIWTDASFNLKTSKASVALAWTPSDDILDPIHVERFSLENIRSSMQAEMSAIVYSLLQAPPCSIIHYLVDNLNIVNVLNPQWQHRTNVDLVKTIHAIIQKKNLMVDFYHVKGHHGIGLNTLVDAIASEHIESDYISITSLILNNTDEFWYYDGFSLSPDIPRRIHESFQAKYLNEISDEIAKNKGWYIPIDPLDSWHPSSFIHLRSQLLNRFESNVLFKAHCDGFKLTDKHGQLHIYISSLTEMILSRHLVVPLMQSLLHISHILEQ
jgi:ribonuclease HI